MVNDDSETPSCKVMKEKPTPHDMNANMLVQTSSGVYEPAGDVIAQRDALLHGCEAALAYLVDPCSAFKENRDAARQIIENAVKLARKPAKEAA